MKAILHCDLLNFKQSAKSIGFLVIFFCGMTIIQQNPLFLGILITILSLTVPFHLFGYDAASGWDKLTLSLPISRASVILSKYILCGGITMILLAFSVAAACLFQALKPGNLAVTQFAALFLCAAAALFLNAVIIPFIVKLGTTKSRYIMMAVIWIPTMLVFFLKDRFFENPVIAFAGKFITTHNLIWISLGALAAAVLLYMASAFISILIYRQKDF